MIPERGPEGRWHWPAYHERGCYRGDVAHVCFVCYCRLVWRVVRGP